MDEFVSRNDAANDYYGQQVPGAPPFVPDLSEVDVTFSGEDVAAYAGESRNEESSYWDDPSGGMFGIDSGLETIEGLDLDSLDDELAPVDTDSDFDVYGPFRVDGELPEDHPATFGRHAAVVGTAALHSAVEAGTAADQPKTRGGAIVSFRIDLNAGTARLESTELAPAEEPPKAAELPSHVYLKTEDQPGFGEWYEAVAKADRAKPMPYESRPTKEERRIIGKVDGAIVKIGDEVGANMRSALQPPEEHHFYSDADTCHVGTVLALGSEAAATLTGSERGSSGYYHPQTGVIWTRQGSAREDRYGITHEKIHGVSLKTVTALPPWNICSTDGSIADTQYRVGSVLMGYQDLRTLPSSEAHGATESFTDMASHKSMLMTGYGPIDPLYGPIDVLSGHVVLATARAYGEEASELENKIIKGLWTPDRTGMEMVREVLGDRNFDRFINLGADITTAQAKRVAVEFGWDEMTIEDLVKAGVGQFAYFDWPRRRYFV